MGPEQVACVFVFCDSLVFQLSGSWFGNSKRRFDHGRCLKVSFWKKMGLGFGWFEGIWSCLVLCAQRLRSMKFHQRSYVHLNRSAPSQGKCTRYLLFLLPSHFTVCRHVWVSEKKTVFPASFPRLIFFYAFLGLACFYWCQAKSASESWAEPL